MSSSPTEEQNQEVRPNGTSSSSAESTKIITAQVPGATTTNGASSPIAKPSQSPKRTRSQLLADLAKASSSPNVLPNGDAANQARHSTSSTPNALRRSSSVPPGRRSINRRSSTTSLMGAGKNRLKDILASDANSIVDLYEKSRVSLGATSIG
mmetsp:Transcript_5233/g.19582  ORF Transcript_5233/g.19582 Transcript_5233/m.19582 type:complete len:153 (+) Transcript_5233:327-785(+)|eukprot:CAMPEP_0117452750 /NCGR_PEP_ID=MMETSP0759-20121206/9803_1 /TAXON_ID=63605 /ORGANISM="Percolomonas cosmopolitus, Strain WS" /LENGTH=152 /DNA_ID=CAMNT_0005245629 /DNA_START=259 /DNA_END=717 /DNA_ORIENTATION=-